MPGLIEKYHPSGFILCPRAEPMKSCRVFDAQIKILEHESIICAGYTCVLHIHSVVEDCTITKLIALIGRDGKPIMGKCCYFLLL